jgi:hypothetical protein
MSRSVIDKTDEKLHFAGHETFPLRYGWLKKAYDAVRDEEISGRVPGSIFNDERAIAEFGVGRNMVLSIKHWALATSVIEAEDVPGERNSRISTGPVGRLLFERGGDPYLEHPGSLWLLHWMLASRPGRATAWHWAFNEFHDSSFDRELLRRRLTHRCEELFESGRFGKGRPISGSTIKRDVECLIRTYYSSSKGSRRAPEDSIECPLAELGLVQKAGLGELYRFRRGPKASLPDEVFLFAVLDFWENLYPERRSFSVEFLTFEKGAPGQVFLFDDDAVADRLARLEELSSAKLRWDESSGMRQLYMHDAGGLDRWELLRGMYSRDMRELAA